MAAALECWSGRPSTDEEMIEQVLMKNSDRSEIITSSFSAPPSPSHSHSSISNLPPKKWQRFSKNFTNTLANLKNNLLDSNSQRLDKHLWGGVVRSLTQLYPGSQLPEKLISDIKRHFDSLPNSYAQAGFDAKDVMLHVRLIEKALAEDQPALNVQEIKSDSEEEEEEIGSVLKISFACNSSVSWQAISCSLDGSLICCKKIQSFEKKGVTLGVVSVLVNTGSEKQFIAKIESSIRSAIKKPKNGGVKLPFGLCGRQEENTKNIDHDIGNVYDADQIQLSSPLPESSVVISVDEWQTVKSGSDEITRWIINSEDIEFLEKKGANSFKGVCRGKMVWIKKLRGCEKGNAYEFEIRQDLLQLMTCGHRNVLQFVGICIDEVNGLCVVTRMMGCGSVHDMIQKNRKTNMKEVMRIALDLAEGLMFINSHGVAFKDLNTQKILLDRQGNAFLGDMGIVTSCNNGGEVTEYETAGYRWLAPEIIAGDPESVTETWMSNVYSFGMIVWEMLTGEAAYSSYSPVQAAVGIAACGLRPDIPRDCPQILRSLMVKCWNNRPSLRPTFADIISSLQKQNIRYRWQPNFTTLPLVPRRTFQRTNQPFQHRWTKAEKRCDAVGRQHINTNFPSLYICSLILLISSSSLSLFFYCQWLN